MKYRLKCEVSGHDGNGVEVWRPVWLEFLASNAGDPQWIGPQEPMQPIPAPAEPERETLWRCNCEELGPSHHTTNRNRASETARLYSVSLEKSTDGGKTWQEAGQ